MEDGKQEMRKVVEASIEISKSDLSDPETDMCECHGIANRQTVVNSRKAAFDMACESGFFFKFTINLKKMDITIY